MTFIVPGRNFRPSCIEGLEHDLRHALAVGLGVQRGLRQQHRVLLRGHSQLVVEGVVPDLLLSGLGLLTRICKACCGISPLLRPSTEGPFNYQNRQKQDRTKKFALRHTRSQILPAARAAISSQFVTMPCSMGYFSVSTPFAGDPCPLGRVETLAGFQT